MPRETKRQWEDRLSRGFTDRLDEVVLTVGEVSLTRRQVIIKLQCANTRAASILNKVLKLNRFRAKSVRQLSQKMDVGDLGRIDGVGEATIHVWMCVMEMVGLNPLKWLDYRSDRQVKINTACRRGRLESKKAGSTKVVKFPRAV